MKLKIVFIFVIGNKLSSIETTKIFRLPNDNYASLNNDRSNFDP